MGEQATILISYGVTHIDIDSTEFGMSAGYDMGFNFNPGSATNPPLIYTLNCPEGARQWIPSFDHPGDWATHETIVKVRKDYGVVSNGALTAFFQDRFAAEVSPPARAAAALEKAATP